MEIYLVRHTTPNIEKGICYGQSDIDLASSWTKEFEKVKANLPKGKNFQLYSSPLKRCALLAESLGKNINYDENLKELDFGDWELKAWDKINETALNTWMSNFVTVKVPNGESYEQLAARVSTSFQNILSRENENKTIIIITHAGPIRALLSKIEEIPLKDSFKIKIEYGDVFHVQYYKERLKLVSVIDK